MNYNKLQMVDVDDNLMIVHRTCGGLPSVLIYIFLLSSHSLKARLSQMENLVADQTKALEEERVRAADLARQLKEVGMFKVIPYLLASPLPSTVGNQTRTK